MTNETEIPGKIAKLPKWAQVYIKGLEEMATRTEERANTLVEQIKEYESRIEGDQVIQLEPYRDLMHANQSRPQIFEMKNTCVRIGSRRLGGIEIRAKEDGSLGVMSLSGSDGISIEPRAANSVVIRAKNMFEK